MILIISDKNDHSTYSVTEYLIYMNIKYFIINTDDIVDIKFKGVDILFEIKNTKIKFSEIKSVWYRRGFINIKNFNFNNIKPIDDLLNVEMSKLIQFVYFKLESLNHLNKITNSDVNKLIVNDIARNLNIDTTDDYIISSKEDLKEIARGDENNFVTKVISGYCIQEFDGFSIYNFTKKINIRENDSDIFFPSLVQNYINKKYELRIFYLDSVYYAMAIMSQNDKQTTIDFRNYNDIKPNRNVPFKLPNEVEIKLDKLMKELDLNSGSIDMIVTPENKYVFLEVNPIGQFGMTSYPCNFNLEKKIANFLIK